MIWLIIIGAIVLAAGAWYMQRLSNDKMLLIPGNEMENPSRFFVVAAKKVTFLKEQLGYEKLTRVQKAIYCIDQIYAQLNNYGSFSDILVNMPDCRFIIDTPNSFRTIGAAQLADFFQRMVAAVGTECLLADTSVRKNRLNSLTPQQQQTLQHAEASFRNCRDNWLLLLAKYVSDKRDDFEYNLM